MSKKELIIVALDNDETIGSWTDISMLYSFYIKVIVKEPPIDVFVKLINDAKCVRPHVKHLFDTLLELKSENHIDGIYMCTAACNTMGWVKFLKDVLEKWYSNFYQTPIKIYDGIIDQETIVKWHEDKCLPSAFKKSGGVIKNLDIIREMVDPTHDNIKVIIIDDRPENIENGIPISISPYSIAVNMGIAMEIYISEWDDVVKIIGTDKANFYKWSMMENWRKYENFPSHFTQCACSDIEIYKSTEYLKSIVKEIKSSGEFTEIAML